MGEGCVSFYYHHLTKIQRIRENLDIGKSFILTSLSPRTSLREKLVLYAVFASIEEKHLKGALGLGVWGGGIEVSLDSSTSLLAGSSPLDEFKGDSCQKSSFFLLSPYISSKST